MIFIFQKYNKFWSISLNTFIKIQPINSWRVHTVILSKLPFNVIIFGEHGKPTRIFDLGVFFSVYYNIFWLFWFSDFYSVKFEWSICGHVFIFFTHLIHTHYDGVCPLYSSTLWLFENAQRVKRILRPPKSSLLFKKK